MAMLTDIPTPDDNSYMSLPYWYPNINREGSKQILRLNTEMGAYLLRNSSIEGKLVLDVIVSMSVKHGFAQYKYVPYLIHIDANNKYMIEQHKKEKQYVLAGTYDSIDDIILSNSTTCLVPIIPKELNN